MSKKALTASAFSLVLILVAAAAPALELGGMFRFDNLGFRSDRTASDTTFAGTDYFWGGSLFVTHGVSDNIALEAGLSRDDTLRLLVYTLFEYQMDYFRLGLGTFLGTFNSTSQLVKSGIITSIGLEVPGAVFVRFRSDNSIGGRMVEIGDYLQERNDISVGFYVPNVICSLNLESKSFTQKQAAAEVVDTLTVYSLKTDIYQKNLPFRVLLTFGYQTLAKKYIDGMANPPINTLNSILLGTQFDVSLSPSVTLTLSLDNGVYSFGQDQLLGISNPGPGGYLFRTTAGFSIDFDRLRSGRLDR